MTFAEKLKIVCSVKFKPAQREHAHGFAIGRFVDSALQARGEGKYQLLKQVKWFTDALEALDSKREDEPDMKTKLEWLKEYGKVPHFRHTLTKTYNDKPYQFTIGRFWDTVLTRAAAGKASDLEIELLQGAKWYDDAVKKRKSQRETRTLGRVPLDIQVGWLCELRAKPIRKEQLTRTYNDKPGPWNAGTFWKSIRSYWTGGKPAIKNSLKN